MFAIALLKESNYLEIHMGDKNDFVEIKILWRDLQRECWKIQVKTLI